MHKRSTRIVAYLRKLREYKEICEDRRLRPEDSSEMIWIKPAMKARNRAWNCLSYEEKIIVGVKLGYPIKGEHVSSGKTTPDGARKAGFFTAEEPNVK